MATNGLLAGLSLALLAGCAAAAAETTYLDEKLDLPPRTAEEVRVFRTQYDVPGRCSPYAVVNTRWENRWKSEADLLDAARAEAARLGANGVLVFGFEPPSNSARLEAAQSGTTARRTGSIVAYRCPAT